MAAARRCSECGASLAGRATHSKTCSDKCRSKRSRRLAKANRDRGRNSALPPHLAEISESVRNENADVAHDVMREELAPIVRESITEETLDAIGKMVALTPTVVQKIQEDLESDDANIRQKAYTLVAKYTIGHPAIVRPPEEEDAKTLVVNFGLPRPGDAVEHVESEVPAEATEVKQCDRCGEDKPVTDFVVGSQRCQTCFDEQQAQAKAMLNAD